MDNDSELAFERWMNSLDIIITSVTGALASCDLSDFPYHDAFKDGRKLQDVAREVLEQNGYSTANLGES